MLKVLHKHSGQIVEYKHKIVPIKCGDKFIPNTWHLEGIRQTSTINILTSDFERYQREGETIIVNNAGVWCTLDNDTMELVQAKTFQPNFN